MDEDSTPSLSDLQQQAARELSRAMALKDYEAADRMVRVYQSLMLYCSPVPTPTRLRLEPGGVALDSGIALKEDANG